MLRNWLFNLVSNREWYWRLKSLSQNKRDYYLWLSLANKFKLSNKYEAFMALAHGYAEVYNDNKFFWMRHLGERNVQH